METQRGFFDAEIRPWQGGRPLPVTSHVPAEDKDRTDLQCTRILDLLLAGHATGTQLYAIARNATARVSELRKLGHDVRCKRIAGGEWMYWIHNVSEPK